MTEYEKVMNEVVLKAIKLPEQDKFMKLISDEVKKRIPKLPVSQRKMRVHINYALGAITHGYWFSLDGKREAIDAPQVNVTGMSKYAAKVARKKALQRSQEQ